MLKYANTVTATPPVGTQSEFIFNSDNGDHLVAVCEGYQSFCKGLAILFNLSDNPMMADAPARKKIRDLCLALWIATLGIDFTAVPEAFPPTAYEDTLVNRYFHGMMAYNKITFLLPDTQ